MKTIISVKKLEIFFLVMEFKCVAYEVVLSIDMLLKLISDPKKSNIFYFCSFLKSKSAIWRTDGCISAESSLLA